MLPVNLGKISSALPLKKAVPRLTNRRLQALENATSVTAADKVRLLQMFIGKRWVTELGFMGEVLDSTNDRAPIVSLLAVLGLPWAENRYDHSGVSWMQVAATKPILDYVITHRDTLTTLEAGVLYGYPTSHSLGFLNLLPRKQVKNRPLDQWFFSGVYSKDCFEDESHYFAEIWKKIEHLSPAIVQEAKAFRLHRERELKSS